jgi:hypothetical protein
MNHEFEKNGYYVARNFFSKELISIAADYFAIKYNVAKFSNDEKSSIVNHSDVADSYTFYNDTLCESILLASGQKISNLLKLNIAPTYTYARIYEEGDVLVPHRDRSACEISATCPIFDSNGKPSTIYISKYTQSRFNGDDKISWNDALNNDYFKAELNPGDVLFYKGCDHYHWREPLKSSYLFQFFMHCVLIDGSNKDWIYDKRPLMGIGSEFRNKD